MEATAAPHLSVVVPIHDEEETIPALHERLSETLAAMAISYEIIFVDDGSSDHSYQLLAELFERDRRVVVLKLARNFGHHLALTAGLERAGGEVIVMMDGDLQDQPEEIPKLNEVLQQGFDVVYGVRKNKQFPLLKRASAAVFYALLSRIARIPPAMRQGIFRVLRRKVVRSALRLQDKERNILELLAWTGYRQTGVEIAHGERFSGSSKYDFSKMLALARSTIVATSRFPLRLPMYIGLTLVMLSLAGYIWFGLSPPAVSCDAMCWWLLPSVGALAGIQLIMLGLFGVYLGAVLTEVRDRPLYILDSVLQHADDQPNDFKKEPVSTK